MSYLGYPDFFEPYIKKVEETRPARVEKRKRGEEFPFMSSKQRQEILKYHPDYKEEGKRELKVGPNKGYRIAHEFVDLLEARSRVDPDKVNLEEADYETDVLVIGGGGAATIAALIAEENGAQVLMATKLRHGDANTMMAEGGIQAATKGEKDSPYYHYLDVIGGGHFKMTPRLRPLLLGKLPMPSDGWKTLELCSPSFPMEGWTPCMVGELAEKGCTIVPTSAEWRSCVLCAMKLVTGIVSKSWNFPRQ